MNIFFSMIIIIVILCSGPVVFFALARRFFGMTKEEERECVKRSVLKILLIFGIVFVFPSVLNLVSSFIKEVVHGSMSLNEYSRHVMEFSFRATYNFYAHLFFKIVRAVK